MFSFKQLSFITLNTYRTNLKTVLVVPIYKNFSSKSHTNSFKNNVLTHYLKPNNVFSNKLRFKSLASNTHDNISSIQIKKRPAKKKKALEEESKEPGLSNVMAFATAEEYDLQGLIEGLRQQDLYEPRTIDNADVVHAVAKYKVANEPRELFFFKDGGVILWNVTDLESSNVLTFLRQYEQDSYSERLTQSESEVMNYKYHTEEGQPSCVDKDGNFVLSTNKDSLPLVKFTFSDGMFLSVKLGIWEASLDKFIEEIEDVTEDLKRGKKIRLNREEVLRKHGELFALRHYLNLSSDMLDTPDFYWENEQLENLYNQVCTYFAINKRTKVMNEKINHCASLIELLSHHLGDKHHIRLEWMIIVLIAVEVVFETIHYIDRYVN